jgi:hypothetical protein
VILPILLPMTLQVAVPTAADEVVVIGQKLATWRASCRTQGQAFTCRTRRSSGDVQIDAIGNAAMEACFPAMRPRYEAAQARGVAPAQRRSMMASANDAYGRCMIARRDAGISALAERRAAARIGS